MAKAKKQPKQPTIAEMRKALGMTQKQLAERLDITTRSIQNYERAGGYVPRVVWLAMGALLANAK
jgi:transcriptional regulator with XRE-family HTH domain